MRRALTMVCGSLLLLAGCSSSTPPERQYKHKYDHGPSAPVDVSQVPDAVPKIEPRTRAGNPPVYTVLGKTYTLLDTEHGYSAKGRASWYGNKFHGEKTSNGEVYDMYAMTAAHKTLPIPSYVRVTNLDNGKVVVVRVNDRGPFHKGRIIDLSYAAASKLDYLNRGTARVKVEAIVVDKKVPSKAARVNEVQRQKAATIDADIYALPANSYLQAGAFGTMDSASALVARLSSVTSFPVVIRSNDSLHRVRIGPVADNRDLQLLRELLSSNNVDGAHLVNE